MDNFVKKAGNNYILDAGKLIGKYRRIEDKDRTRTLDIYMYSPGPFRTTFMLLYRKDTP